MTELEVPQAARDAVRDTDKYARNVDPQVLAIATPVVIAYARQLLFDIEELEPTALVTAARLRRHLKELER